MSQKKQDTSFYNIILDAQSWDGWMVGMPCCLEKGKFERFGFMDWVFLSIQTPNCIEFSP